MNRIVYIAVALVMIITSAVSARDGSKEEKSAKKADGKWANTVWKKVNNLAKEKRSFKVEKATTVAGVRGSEAEDRLLTQLYFRGGGKYPSRLELSNAIDILETSIKASPNDPSVPESKFFIAQCQDQLGVMDEAIDTYQEIVKYFPDSPYSPQAGEAITRLE